MTREEAKDIVRKPPYLKTGFEMLMKGDYYKAVDQIFNDHEAQLRAKEEQNKELIIKCEELKGDAYLHFQHGMKLEAQLRAKDEFVTVLNDKLEQCRIRNDNLIFELKAKDEELETLKRDMFGRNFDSIINMQKALDEKDEEIERLKAELAIATKRFDAKNRESKEVKKLLRKVWDKHLKDNA